MFFAQSEAPITSANVVERFPEFVPGIVDNFGAYAPEFILCFGVCWVILVDLFRPKSESGKLGIHAMVFVGLSMLALFMNGYETAGESLFRGMVVNDGVSVFFKALMLAGTAICIPMVMMHEKLKGRRMGEFYGLLLGSVIGMFLMASANNLLMFFLGIEFASYTSYLLTGYIKEDRKAAEGGLKYVIFGSVASGVMVYGLSLVYGLTGSLELGAVAETLAVAGTSDVALLLAAMMTFAGFAYKISAFPLHFWTPDVYEGAPIPFTAFLAVVSKMAGFAALIRFVYAFGLVDGYNYEFSGGLIANMNWPLLIGVVAALTMSIGNFSALFQNNVKRLLAYSSIAHAGYLLMGIATMSPLVDGAKAGWPAVIFYMVIYLFMNLGAFLIAALVASRTGNEEVEGFRGLGKRSWILSCSMTLFLVSLIGLPPTAGFAGKFQLIAATVDSELYWLAVVAVINSVVSVYYYMRLVKLMFLDEGEGGKLAFDGATSAFVLALAFPVLYLGVSWDATYDYISRLSIAII